MSQKLPAVVAAMALLVVIGVWWAIHSGPPPVPEISEPASSELRPKVAERPRGQTREDLRHRRDAWAAAHDQRRERDSIAAAAMPGRVHTPSSPSNRGNAGWAGAATDSSRDESNSNSHPSPNSGRTPLIVNKENHEEIERLKKAALTDPDPEERINALWSLSVSDEESALPVLGAALRDEDGEVRLAAVQELGGLDDERAAVDALTLALEDSDPEIRAEAIRVIGDTDDPRAASLVERLTHDVDPDVREEAEAVVDAAD